MQWIERVAKNIFSLSSNKQDIRSALDEWEYRSEMNDRGVPDSICELCNHPNIRLQFEIVNKHNLNSLLIGSECITKFGVKVFDENGNLLEDIHAKKKVAKDRRKLIVDSKIKGMINSILVLSTKQGEQINFKEFVDDFERLGGHSPKQLFAMFYRMKVNHVKYNKTDFKCYIRKPHFKQQLLTMEVSRINDIWPALSTSQRKLVAHKL